MESLIEKAVIYGRMSKDKGDTKDGSGNSSNESLDVQEACCEKYCTFKEFNVVARFYDNDTTGDMFKVAFEERKGAKQLVSIIESGKHGIKHLVIAKLDRLGRTAEHLLGRIRWLEEHGVTLHIVNLGGDTVTTNGATGKLLLCVLAAFSEFELETIRTRTEEALAHRRHNNERYCKSVYGWDVVDSGKTKTVDKKEVTLWSLVQNSEEQEWIKFMADMRNMPDVTNTKERGLKTGYWKIADSLNKQGVKSKTGLIGRWTGGMVHRILHSKHTTEKVEA